MHHLERIIKILRGNKLNYHCVSCVSFISEKLKGHLTSSEIYFFPFLLSEDTVLHGWIYIDDPVIKIMSLKEQTLEEEIQQRRIKAGNKNGPIDFKNQNNLTDEINWNRLPRLNRAPCTWWHYRKYDKTIIFSIL